MLSQHFYGFDAPRYTQVPDQLFDELLPHLSGAELKVLLYIIRRTFGFKKDSDAISLSQICKGITTTNGRILDEGTGLHESTVLTALKGLAAQNIIIAIKRQSPEKGYEPTMYCLNVRGYTGPGDPFPDFPGRGPRIFRGPLPGKSGIQETVLQETESQETDNSNFRLAPTQNYVNTDCEYMISCEGAKVGGDIPGTPRTRLKKVLKNSAPATPTLDAPGPLALQYYPVSPSQTAYGPERQILLDYVSDVAREFGDEAHPKSSTSRAVNLYNHSGLSLEAFIEVLLEARAVTKEWAGNIRKQRVDEASRGLILKNKMPYFFAVIEDRLGLKVERPSREGAGRDARLSCRSEAAPAV